MLLKRVPAPALRPFVKMLWAQDHRSPPKLVSADREHVLPTGTMHLAFRLSDHPLRLFEDANDRVGYKIGHSIVGGARSTFYVREIADAVRSVGAQFHPGGADLLLGAPAEELAETHTPLEELWGSLATDARERLLEAGRADKQLDILEALLAERLPRVRGLHPAVAQALDRFTTTSNVRQVVREYGYSHRRFISLFRNATGFTPKVYCRILRFQEVLERIAIDSGESWVDLALAAGYSDQPHFNREFRQFSGLTPGEYRKATPTFTNHVPLNQSSR